MPLLNERDLRDKLPFEKSQDTKLFSETILLNESVVSNEDNFDIFLSHRKLDADIVLSLKKSLEDEYHFSVYVDWEIDKKLSREYVDKHTASIIRKRMRQCESLILAFSEKVIGSIWIPWELGYFDGYDKINGKLSRVSIMPITKERNDTENFKGQEYLGLYPYITEQENRAGNMRLWVNNEKPSCYVHYGGWLKREMPYKR